jgi:DNA-binding MarR family transcriptional regulator/GNAT superfamily N-acetyltransferase
MLEAGTEDVAELRAFTRFWTRTAEVLTEGLLQTRFTLTEARVLFELAQREVTEVTALRRELGLDGGYLSRLLARLQDDGVVVLERSGDDARRRRARLTAAGRRAYAELDRRSSRDAAALLERVVPSARPRLLGAMTAIRALLDQPSSGSLVVLRGPRVGELGWVVARNGAIYADEHGWDEDYEALVARIVVQYVDDRDPEREALWIAERDGEPVGCVFCVRRDERTAQLRLLLVEPAARGLGIGGRLTEECLRFAARAGYERIVLWTNDVLTDARRIYERAGFTLEASEPHRSFGRELVGQTWGRDL